MIAHAGDVFALARQGNSEALALCDGMAYDIAVMFFRSLHMLLILAVFVIGGGVMKGKDVFFEKMERDFRSMIHKGMQTVKFVKKLS